jgi:hypothetical protein
VNERAGDQCDIEPQKERRMRQRDKGIQGYDRRISIRSST